MLLLNYRCILSDSLLILVSGMNMAGFRAWQLPFSVVLGTHLTTKRLHGTGYADKHRVACDICQRSCKTSCSQFRRTNFSHKGQGYRAQSSIGCKRRKYCKGPGVRLDVQASEILLHHADSLTSTKPGNPRDMRVLASLPSLCAQLFKDCIACWLSNRA